MRDQKNAITIDIQRLLSKKNDFIYIDCPSCNRAGSTSSKYSKQGFEYVSCDRCRTFYVNPRPTPEILSWFYKGSANYDYWNKYIFPASESARLKNIIQPRVERLVEICKKYDVPFNSLLEVGSGFGTFCACLKEKGLFNKILAIEPTPGAAKTCMEKNVEVFEGTIEEFGPINHECFNVVVSFEVIEHLFSPIDFITSAKKMLGTGGVLVLTCPNGAGFDIETLGIKSNTVDHEHLNYFNPGSLISLVKGLGFEVLEISTPGRLDADIVRNMVLSGEFSLEGQPFLKQVLIENWESLGESFQEYLVENQLSSNMWIVARKS